MKLCCLITILVLSSTPASACNDIQLALCGATLMNFAVPTAMKLKREGGFRDYGACEEWGRSARMMADGGVDESVARQIAGTCGECACREAWDH